MKLFVVSLGALLLAAPIFSQEPDALQFTLHEARAQVEQKMGRPANVTAYGDFESWEYQIGVEDHHEFSHVLLFRASKGELISYTRNFEPAQNVDTLFPETESRVEFYPDAQNPAMKVRVRRLKDGRVLLALGSGGPGEPAAQVMLIQESELKHFHEWLSERLEKQPIMRAWATQTGSAKQK